MFKILFLLLCVHGCSDLSHLAWREISFSAGASQIAANSKDDAVWIVSRWAMGDGFAIAKLDEEGKTWVKDELQPEGAY
jgi:hypothetical protein